VRYFLAKEVYNFFILILNFIKGVQISELLHTELYLIPNLLGILAGIEFFLRTGWCRFFMKNPPRGERWLSSKASGETPFKNSKSN
jgi:hypothetical protein